ncbi:sulfurtransferase TusA family protein [Aurantivibrio infirmus]
MDNDVKSIDTTIDASGLTCPLPLLKAKQGLKPLQSGMCLKLISTDPGSVKDFKVFAELSGNRLLEFNESGEIYTFVLQKA